jgi:hypothetical protein
MNQPSSWDEWAQQMLKSMADNTEALSKLSDRIASIEKAQAVADVKYGLLGVIAGGITGALTSFAGRFWK